jgi:hypothetical protein
VAGTTTNAVALAHLLRSNLGLKCSRSHTRYGAWKHLAVVADHESDWMPYEVVVAMHGIDHAVNTGRLAGEIATAIRSLSDWQMCGLIAEVAATCKVSGVVPAYLINKFTH